MSSKHGQPPAYELRKPRHNREQVGTCTAAEFEGKIVVTLTILSPQGYNSALVGGGRVM